MVKNSLSIAVVPFTLQQSSLLKSLYQVWKKYVFSVYLLPDDPYMWYILEAEISSFNLNWPMPAKHRNLSQIWAESGLQSYWNFFFSPIQHFHHSPQGSLWSSHAYGSSFSYLAWLREPKKTGTKLYSSKKKKRCEFPSGNTLVSCFMCSHCSIFMDWPKSMIWCFAGPEL